MCCKKISATVRDIGDPIATPLLGWYIVSWYSKRFCLSMVWRIAIICLVFCLSLFFISCSVIFSVSTIGMLTYRSFMLNVAILWFSFTLIVGRLHARLSEFCVLCSFSSCSCCFSMLFSFFSILFVGAFLY